MIFIILFLNARIRAFQKTDFHTPVAASHLSLNNFHITFINRGFG